MRTNGTPNDEMPAPDGEEYFAMSLYFAAGRWGNGTGIYDYQAAADRLLTDMVHRAADHGPNVPRHPHGQRDVFDRTRHGPVFPGHATSPIPRTICPRSMNCGRGGVRRRTGLSGPGPPL